MTWLSKAIVTVMFMALILGADGTKHHMDNWDSFEEIDTNDIYQWLCQNNLFASYVSFCRTTTPPSSTTQSTTRSTTVETSESSSTTTTFELETTTPSTTDSTSVPSSLERAHWCHLLNGTYLPLGYTFMYTACALCQCTQTRAVVCTTLRCMNTFCIDNSTPSPKPGQCCAQCAYEATSTSCEHNGITFPHGTIIKSRGSTLRCWCQLGTIECRRSITSVFAGLDLWGDGTAIYVMMIIVFVLLSIGTLLCCTCTVFYYYYYQRNQHLVQQVYDQYWNNAGWQPMDEEGYVADGNADEKQAEAEQNQYDYEYPTGNSEEYIPPPYALYNAAYAAEENAKDQKNM
ncbi:unnamed protein product [Rotaria sp. Silwood2]|nr:unnamed protein product [Rotaria sp. Silwood2]CAF2766392.1 unnamed protein product [Rotaria sp. Silwood2]CAF2987279.1 unnamed protein product [Rotaria sp. Silwood2]CAF3131077.1 unnamed protein product [Rotaria sp. Silwood2]CAF4476363.1 unnamed protein product [Rotaria sp. Silwood2]